MARSDAAILAADPARSVGTHEDACKRRDGVAPRCHCRSSQQRPGHVECGALELGSMLAMGLGEYLLHGLDIARALSQPWRIEPEDARLVLAAAMPLLPLLVNPATTAGVRVAYDLRIRGGERFMVRIDDGALAVGRSDGGVELPSAPNQRRCCSLRTVAAHNGSRC